MWAQGIAVVLAHLVGAYLEGSWGGFFYQWVPVCPSPPLPFAVRVYIVVPVEPIGGATGFGPRWWVMGLPFRGV